MKTYGVPADLLYTFLTSPLREVSGELQAPIDNSLLYLQDVTIGTHQTEVSALPDIKYRFVVLSTHMLVTTLIRVSRL
jgi:hypothetical protein